MADKEKCEYDDHEARVVGSADWLRGGGVGFDIVCVKCGGMGKLKYKRERHIISGDAEWFR